MRIYDITIFIDKNNPIASEFNKDGTALHLHSGLTRRADPEIVIFFSSQQEATNFKNAIIQSWEAFLRKEEKNHE